MTERDKRLPPFTDTRRAGTGAADPFWFFKRHALMRVSAERKLAAATRTQPELDR